MTPEELEQAARWHTRMDDVPRGASSDAVRASFTAWHRSRDAHRRAFDAVVTVDAVARDIRDEPALQHLADAALARAVARGERRGRWGIAAMAGLVVVALPVAALTVRHLTAPATVTAPPPGPPVRAFATGIGEQRIVNMGAARVTLDTASRVAVRDGVMTIAGQAYIEAGRAPVRLRLPGGDVTIRSGGVNVRTGPGDIATILADGGAVTADPMQVGNGDLLTVAARGMRVETANDPAAVISWRDGWLLFDDVRLERATAEVNRYRRSPIRLARGAGALRISGSFRTDDTAGFLAAVAASLPATVDRSGEETMIVPSGTVRN